MSTPEDSIETPDPEDMADENFIAAKFGKEAGGLTFEPWTPARKIAAQSMGLLFPHIGEEGYEQMSRTGFYPGSMRDTVIFCWLSSITDRRVITQAVYKPKAAWEEALAWAEANDLIDTASPKFMEAYSAFTDKISAEMSARSKPEEPEGAREEGDGPKI